MDSKIPYPFRHELPDAQCLLIREAGRKRNQVAAVDARRDIARTAQTSRHDVRHAADGGVAGPAAKSRVVEIQGVDVDGEHRDTAFFPLRDRPIAFQQLLQIGQGEQSRQAIVADGHAGRLVRAAQ